VDLLNRFKSNSSFFFSSLSCMFNLFTAETARKAGYFGMVIGFLRSILYLPTLAARRSVILDQIATCPIVRHIFGFVFFFFY